MANRSTRAQRGGREMGAYLTDGTNLYRFVGWVVRGRLAEFEDCHSLDLLVLPADDLERCRLTPVPCALA